MEGFFFVNLGYRLGSEAMERLLSSGLITKLINTKVLRWFEENVRILLNKLREELIKDFLNLLDVFLVSNRNKSCCNTCLL